MKIFNKILAVACCTAVVFSACTNEKANKSAESFEKEIFVNKIWNYKNYVCSEKLSFGEDGEFSYWEACGSPVDDYDCYEEYTYNKKKNRITVKGTGFKNVHFDIVFADEDRLFLLVDGEPKEFYSDELVKILPAIADKYVENVSDYARYAAVVDCNEDSFMIAPPDYDGDAKDSFKDRLETVKLADDVEFVDLSVNTTIKEAPVENMKDISTFDYTDEDGNIVYTLYLDKDGNILSEVYFDEDGNTVDENGNIVTDDYFRYENDEVSYVYFDENGNIACEEFLDENWNVISKEYYEGCGEIVSDKYYKKSSTVKKSLSKEEVLTVIRDNESSAFLWYNDDLEISKVLFYGEKIAGGDF